MRTGTIAFLAGIFLLHQLPELPDSRWIFLLFLFIPLVFYTRKLILPSLFVAGFLWALFRASLILDAGLDQSLEGKDLFVDGIISSLPQQRERSVRFEFEVHTLRYEKNVHDSPGRILLSWYARRYAKIPDLKIGQHWQLKVRLKRPHGFMNPGGFDYERWMFLHRLRAKGYVKQSDTNQLLQQQNKLNIINRLRTRLRESIQDLLENKPYAGLLMALVIGDKSLISPSQWAVLTRTGTNHLMAISGLHIGLIAGFAFFLVQFIWKRFFITRFPWPAAKAGAVAAILAAAFYAALAGFSIPTQRALIMVMIVMLATLIQRRSTPSVILAAALFLVLLFDPLAVLDAGFWLSFCAVTIILFTMTGRVGQWSARGKWGEKWWRVQFVIAIGLTPLLFIFFQQTSVMSPVANLFAVPWTGFIIVPLTLVSAMALFVYPPAGAIGLKCAHWSMSMLWLVLDKAAASPASVWVMPAPSWWVTILSVIGIVWLLSPGGLPGRWLGVIWLLPLVLVRPPSPEQGDMWFTLLDVGQGLSAVVRTNKHTLVFDTGPRFSQRFNTGSAVVIPFLRQAGVPHVDTLLVSHGDNDHIGGAASLVQQFSVLSVISSVPEKIDRNDVLRCGDSRHWQWEGVDFTVLHPPDNSHWTGNNASCVLLIKSNSGSVLLTGDIERRAEARLVKEYGHILSADVLVAPHHGSRTSSSPAFLDAVKPEYALFPVGYRNRYGFPKPDVVARYRARQAKVFESAGEGAITIKFNMRQKSFLSIASYRQTSRRFWHSR